MRSLLAPALYNQNWDPDGHQWEAVSHGPGGA